MNTPDNLIGRNTNSDNSGFSADQDRELKRMTDDPANRLENYPGIVMPGEVVKGTPNNKP